MPNPSLVTGPTDTPITKEELKQHVRFEIDSEDDLLETYIATATEQCEAYARRKFVTQTWRYVVLPTCNVVKVPLSPVQSLTVKDGDGADVEYELDDTKSQPVLTLETVPDRLVVEAVVGYGDAATDVPHRARHAVRVGAAHYWENRSDAGPLPQACYDLLNSIRIKEIA